MLQHLLANQEKAETNRKADLENLKRMMEGITNAKLIELMVTIEKCRWNYRQQKCPSTRGQRSSRKT
jgi:hypothetical protein